MKKTVIIALVLMVIIVSCATEKKLRINNIRYGARDLRDFFEMCTRDSINASKVIRERDLIMNLTHLHRMNSGGKRYYLLERETITEMIKSVTEGVYSDFILINRHGIVIYTRRNDDIFGKKVTTYLAGTPLKRCFQETGNDLYIEDIAEFHSAAGRYNMFISYPVIRKEGMQGIFVLQIGIEKLKGILSPDTHIVDREGNLRITSPMSMIFKPFPFYKKLDLSGLKNNCRMSFKTNSDTYEYYPFSFKNLRWIVVTTL